MTRTLVIGDALVDIHVRPMHDIAFGTDTPAATSITVGGAGANIAAWLAYQGIETHLAACVGRDPFAGYLIEHAERAGIQCLFQSTDQASTGTCVVIIDHHGERSMLPDSGANRYLMPPNIEPQAGIEHLHVSGYSLAHPFGPSLLEFMLGFSGTTSLDLASTAIVKRTPAIQAAAQAVDIVFGTVTEFADLDEMPTGPLTVVKDGARGVKACSGSSTWDVAAPSVHVVSTTGAGDAFAAGFLHGWFSERREIATALASGTALAERALSRVAAWPPARNTEE